MKKQGTLIFLIVLLGMFSIQAQEPSLEWVRFIEGEGDIVLNDISVDSEGNIYTVGRFVGPSDFDPSLEAQWFTGETESFILKQNIHGDFIWVKFLENGAGISFSDCHQILADENGFITIAGQFTGKVDFDPGIGLFEMESSGSGNSYLMRLNADGELIWAIQHTGKSRILDLIEDQLGNIVVSGRFQFDVDFDGSPSDFILDTGNSLDGYIAKYNQNGDFVWVKAFQGGDSQLYGISTDSLNNIFGTGTFKGVVDFDGGIGEYFMQSSYDGQFSTEFSDDIFIIKVDQNGNLLEVGSFGSFGDDFGYSTQIDSNSDFYFSGVFFEEVDFDLSDEEYSFSVNAGSSSDGVIAKYDSEFNLIWAKQISGFGYARPTNIKIKPEGNNLIVAGYTSQGPSNHYFQPGNALVLNSVFPGDGFLIEISDFGDFVWGLSMGGTSAEKFCEFEFFQESFLVPFRYNETMDFAPGDSTLIYSTEMGNFDGVILKLSNEYISSVSNNISSQVTKALVYPNPSSGTYNILLPQLQNSVQVNVYDHLARLVSSQQERSTSFQVEISGASGLYFIELLGEDGFLERQKVLKH